MIIVKATNIRCDQYPDGEQVLHVSDAGALAWGKVKIADASDNNILQYSSIEQFLTEWTDIKYMKFVESKIERERSDFMSSLVASGAI